MIIANFTDGYSTATAHGLYQWDYGQILEIHGLSLPPAVEVHFAMEKSIRDAKIRIGNTVDKVTKVAIPEYILEQSGDAVAYIYISDTTSGKTVKKINMPIIARQKPEAFDAPEDAQLFREAIEAVNAAAEQSENSADTAEQAKNLVMQIGREVTENKEYVDKKIDDFNVLHQQAVQDIDNAGNNQAESINAAGQKAIENIGTGIDPTFTQEGKAADAKATGDKLSSLKDDLGGLDDNTNRQTIFSKNTMVHTITNIVIDNYTYRSNFKKGEEYEVIVSCNSTSTKQIGFLNSNMGTPYVVADEVTNKVWENYVYRVIMPEDSSGLMIYVGEQGASISVTVNYIVNVKNTLGNPTMINKSTNEVGAINESGILDPVDGYISTDFINVKGGCDYNIFATLLTMYNDGKEYIGRLMYLKGVYTLDSNVSYVRLTETSDKSDKMLFQLNVFDRIRNIEDTLINDSISFDKNRLPFVNIDVNDFDTMTKDNKLKGKLSFTVGNEIKFKLPIKIGWQGSGSLEYPKKNFSITLYKDMGYKKKANLKINDWYATSGYHLKANYYDHSMVRNCVATQLAKTVCGNNEPNGAMCYVESFPFILLVNGTFYGCYTWNLKQDNDLFMMDKTNPNHIIYRNNSTTSIVDFDNWEFRGDAVETDEMKSKLQSLINWCVNSTDEDFVANLGNKFDLHSLFGYILFAEYGMCADSLSNNWTIATWDGNTWYNIYYDLDICFGMNYLGADGSLENMEQYQVNTFFKRVTSLFTSEINSYYSQLRKLGVLDIDYVYNKFFEYKSMFGMPNLIAEYQMWQSRPNSDLDIDILKNWLRNKLYYMDLKHGYSTN